VTKKGKPYKKRKKRITTTLLPLSSERKQISNNIRGVGLGGGLFGKQPKEEKLLQSGNGGGRWNGTGTRGKQALGFSARGQERPRETMRRPRADRDGGSLKQRSRGNGLEKEGDG